MAQTYEIKFRSDFTSDVADIIVTAGESALANYLFGPTESLPVLSITGFVNSTPIDGLVGNSGSFQITSSGTYFDNVVYVPGNSSDPDIPNHAYPSESVGGVGYYGLEFAAGDTEYNLSDMHHVFPVRFDDNRLANVSQGTSVEGRAVLSSVACYCRDTRMGTPWGDVPVDCLTRGDVLVTASGEYRPIRWIGRRSHVGRFLAANPNLQPVRFRTGSLGRDMPRRDLLVSPEHAMFLDGVLVPAKLLVNGRMIVQERGLEKVDYYHVELDSHDVILAEGAPSETFVDNDSRGVFHNASEWARLYPGRARVPAVFCAPRLDQGLELDAIRRRLDLAAEWIVQAA